MSTPAPKYLPPFEAQFDDGRAQEFIIRKLLRWLHTATIVQVQSVTPLSASVGVVQVQPMVLDNDTNGFVIAQSPIYNVPYFRLQGGVSAVVLDPVVGDIGLAVFAERDITAVVQTQQPGPAATQRDHSSDDGLYLGGFLNGAPTQWVKFLPGAAGIDISTPGALTLEGQTISMSAGTTITMTAPGGITLTSGGESFTVTSTGAQSTAVITAPDVILPRGSVNNHVHTGVQTGTGNTGNMTG